MEILASRLLSARAENQQIASADLPVPVDLDEAMRVQGQIAMALSPDVAGWKVAMPGSVAVAAPLYPLAEAGSAGEAAIAWIGRLGIEVELAVKLKEDIGRREDRAWTRAALLDRIDGVYLGIEPVGGRLKEGSSAPFPLYLADSLDNKGYILGQILPIGIIDRVAAGEVSIKLSGAATWHGPAAHAHADPLHFLISYANAQIDHLGGLKAGQIITIGSLCGSVPVAAPGTVHVAFDGSYLLDLTISR